MLSNCHYSQISKKDQKTLVNLVVVNWKVSNLVLYIKVSPDFPIFNLNLVMSYV